MLECTDGTSSGADEKTTGAGKSFAYAYICLPDADDCAAGADVNKLCSENSERARMECKRAQMEYNRVRAVS
jgi:hypothetical protein